MTALASTTLAESDRDRAAARAAADAGVDAYEAGRYVEAVDLFGRAEQLVHAPTHLLFIARSLTKLGRFVEARENYLKIGRERLAPNAPPAFRRAQSDAETELSQIQGRIGTVTIAVQGDTSGAELIMDHAVLSAAVIGIPFPVDPGSHVFQVRAGSDVSPEVTVKVGEGERQSVNLRLERSAASARAAGGTETGAAGSAASGGASDNSRLSDSSGSAPAAQDGGSSHKVQNILGISALAVGAVGIGLGTFWTIRAMDERSLADQVFQRCNPSMSCGMREKDYIDHQDARYRKFLRHHAIPSFIVGGVGVAAGIVLLLVHPGDSSASTAPRFQVTGGADWIGVAGKF